ncbi:Transcriptional activator protein CzcR [compost metagenome]
MEYLLINKNIILSRDKILQEVWKYDFNGDSKIVDVFIRYLRSKIDDKFENKLIKTVRGFGYVIEDENDKG